MTSRIAYNKDAVGTGRDVAEYVAQVQEALSKGRRLLAKLNSMSYGQDWTALEGEIAGMTAGTGQSLWTIIATAQAKIDSAEVAELSRLDRA